MVFTGFVIAIYIVMLFINYNLYALVMDIANLNVLLSIAITYFIVLDKVNIVKTSLNYFLRTVPILIFLIAFIIIVPSFTYKESQYIVLNNYNKTSKIFSINEVSTKRLRVTKSPNLFVKYYYLLSLKAGNEIQYYMFNPVTGDYLETEKPLN